MRRATTVLGLAFVLGCGGGSSGFHPSVSGSKPFGQITDPEAMKLCTETLTYLQAQLQKQFTVETECRAVGAFVASIGLTDQTTDAQVQASCQIGYNLCKSMPPDAGVSFDAGSTTATCSMATAPGGTCTATVDQYTACVNETANATNNLFPPCNQLTRAKVEMLAGGDAGATAMGPACTAFQAACPGVSMGTAAP
jgi:hypothetical protein